VRMDYIFIALFWFSFLINRFTVVHQSE
jgi:hypothetical protein